VKQAEKQRDFLAVYGTLRRAFLWRRELQIVRNVKFYGHGLLRGKLSWQHAYPGLIDWPGVVRVEIFLVVDFQIWAALDRYEGFFADRPQNSLFERRRVRLLRPAISAQAYYLGRNTPKGVMADR
jgi:gamma-glutamylcyclotransferase (GGCT)/AIG2-like uncharacterized protein YtfP